MLGSTLHWSRMLDGISYLRITPDHYRGIANRFPEESALKLIEKYDVDLVIMSEIPNLVSSSQLAMMVDAAKKLGEVEEVTGGKYILRMKKDIAY